MQTQSMLIALVLGVAGLAAGYLLGRSTPDALTSLRGENVGSVSAASTSPGTEVEVSSLTEGQQRMLAAFGVDVDRITVTPQMAACAEARLGVARVAEIVGGATPTLSEGATLLACYEQ